MADQQIEPRVEPIACRSCGKSARVCGRGLLFCCDVCAGSPGKPGTSFRTHYPPVLPGGDA